MKPVPRLNPELLIDGHDWRSYPLNERYQFNEFGQCRKVTDTSVWKLKTVTDRGGYLWTWISLLDGRRKMVKNHAAVMLLFIGARPPGLEVNHKDGDKKNNAISNLEYVTRSENIRHAVRLGLHRVPEGIGHFRAKFTEEQVRQIRARYARGDVSIGLISRDHKVCHDCISDMVQGRTWKSVK